MYMTTIFIIHEMFFLFGHSSPLGSTATPLTGQALDFCTLVKNSCLRSYFRHFEFLRAYIS